MPDTSKMYTYNRLWLFAKDQNSKVGKLLGEAKSRMGMLRQNSSSSSEQDVESSTFHPRSNSTCPAAVSFKGLAYLVSALHIVAGFILVLSIAYAVPEMMNNPTRLAFFWMYVFIYLFLGCLTILGLYQNSSGTIKAGLIIFILLQVALLLTSSNLISQCNRLIKLSEYENPSSVSAREQCKHSYFVSTRILIPLFVHTILFCSAVGTYLWRKEDDSAESSQVNPLHKDIKTYEFANITIIIEEVE